MERYESYKDSGVKWLGEIPSHWEVKHLRNFLTLFSEKGFGDKQLLSVTREKGVILRDKDNKEENHNFVPDDLSGYKHLNKGDFVINKMKSWQGSYGVSDFEGIVSPAYFTCKLKGVNPDFFSCAIRSKAYIGFFMQYSKGIRVDQWDLDPSSMKDIPFVLPSDKEQNAIVSYLNEATSKIDAAIAQQQKMIDLLNERKQIIINNAVTKGLDPNAPMKDSGIDWIGSIPEHWSLMKLKYLGMIKSGDGIKNEQLKENGEYPVWGGNGLMGYIDTYNTKDNAIVIGRVGALCGNVRLVYSPVFVTDNALIYNITGIIDHKFLLYAMRAANLNSLNSSNAQPLITGTKVKNVSIPYPSKDIQKEIVSYIDNTIYQIDKVIENYSSSISLLQERKQIIINDVVTGKAKVVR